jgi:diacylglycerol O-acyltransferase/trehalose O-mycolyltransferase
VTRRRAIAIVVLLVAACAAPAGGAPSAAPSPSLSATTLVSPSPTSAPAATLPTVGQAADDGARIVGVATVDARTRDLTIESPAVGAAQVRLLLPGQFDAQPTATWPALYLLHGSNGSHLDWTQRTDVARLTEPTDLLVVMPDAGDEGWYSDWWNGARGGAPMWETFHLDELPQLLERNWHASDKRVVAGHSMGGYGAMEYAARRPGMFLAAASFSGVLDTVGGQLDFVSQNLWGDIHQQADIWKAHNPLDLASALKGSKLYVSYGNGKPGPFDIGPVSPDDPEAWIALRNGSFVDRLRQLDIPVTVDAYGPGSHDWPYWERALHRSLPLLLEALGE